MQTRPARDYYEILGFIADEIRNKTNITQAQIRSAYRAKALLLHPDKNKDINAKEQFTELQKAYETLNDSAKRYAYDHPRFAFVHVNVSQNQNDDDEELKKQRKEQLNEAFKNLHGLNGFARKLAAFIVTLESFAVLMALVSAATAVAAVAYLPFLITMCCAPQWLGKKIFNQETFFVGGQVKASVGLALTFVIPFIPLIGLAASVANSQGLYKELAVKGISKAGNIFLVATILGLTAGLLAAYPPAGVATALGVGGKIATALGMGSYSTGAFSFCFGSLVAGATCVAGAAVSKVSSCVGSCFKSIKNCFLRKKSDPLSVPKDEAIELQTISSPRSSQAYTLQVFIDKPGQPTLESIAVQPMQQSGPIADASSRSPNVRSMFCRTDHSPVKITELDLVLNQELRESLLRSSHS